MRLKRFLRSVSRCMPLHRRTNTTRGGAHASQVRLLPASASASMHTCTCSLTATPMHYVYTFSHAVLYLDARTHRTFLTTRTHCAHVFTRCLSHLQGLRVPPIHNQRCTSTRAYADAHLHARAGVRTPTCTCTPARAPTTVPPLAHSACTYPRERITCRCPLHCGYLHSCPYVYMPATCTHTRMYANAHGNSMV